MLSLHCVLVRVDDSISVILSGNDPRPRTPVPAYGPSYDYEMFDSTPSGNDGSSSAQWTSSTLPPYFSSHQINTSESSTTVGTHEYYNDTMTPSLFPITSYQENHLSLTSKSESGTMMTETNMLSAELNWTFIPLTTVKQSPANTASPINLTTFDFGSGVVIENGTQITGKFSFTTRIERRNYVAGTSFLSKFCSP